MPFFTASRAAIPNLVESEDDVSWANSLVTMGVHAGIAVGPLIGGVLVATIGASSVFALNAVTFLRVDRTDPDRPRLLPAGATTRMRTTSTAGMAAGLAFLWRDRVLRRHDDRLVRVRARDGHGHGGRRARSPSTSAWARSGFAR